MFYAGVCGSSEREGKAVGQFRVGEVRFHFRERAKIQAAGSGDRVSEALELDSTSKFGVFEMSDNPASKLARRIADEIHDPCEHRSFGHGPYPCTNCWIAAIEREFGLICEALESAEQFIRQELNQWGHTQGQYRSEQYGAYLQKLLNQLREALAKLGEKDDELPRSDA